MSGTWKQTTLMDWVVDYWEPERLSEDPSPVGCVVWMHGIDGVPLSARPAAQAVLTAAGLPGVAPQLQGGIWIDSPEPSATCVERPLEFIRTELARWIREQWSVAPPRIAVSGVETGAQGALQLSYRDARRFPVVAAIGPKVDLETWHGHGLLLDRMFANAEAVRQQSATLQIHPLNWPREHWIVCDPRDDYCFPGTQTLLSKLSSSGIPCNADLETSAGGYGWEYWERMLAPAFTFMQAGLKRESSRLA